MYVSLAKDSKARTTMASRIIRFKKDYPTISICISYLYQNLRLEIPDFNDGISTPLSTKEILHGLPHFDVSNGLQHQKSI